MKIIWTSFFLVGLLISNILLAGNESSGGGSLIRTAVEGSPVAIDLVDAGVLSADLGFQIVPSEASLKLGFDRFQALKESNAFRIAQEKISVWLPSSKTARVILDALENMDWYYTPYSIPAIDGENTIWVQATLADDYTDLKKYGIWADSSTIKELASAYPQAEVASAVRYTNGFGMIVAEAWNSIDENQQAALLIHEAVRHMQKAYSTQTEQAIDDKKLRKITSIIATEEPGENYISLDNVELWNESVQMFIRFRRGYLTNSVVKVLAELESNLLSLRQSGLVAPVEFVTQLKEEVVSKQNSINHDNVGSVLDSSKSDEERDYGTQVFEKLSGKIRDAGYRDASVEAIKSLSSACDKLGLLLIERSIDRISSRTHLYVDLTRKIDGVFGNIVLDEVFDFANGLTNKDSNGNRRTGKEKRALQNIIQTLHKEIEKNLKNGSMYLPEY